tara:strand:- start:826 stop:1164 length:339 start_codon:yes stop_codon:yes gene_type:complete
MAISNDNIITINLNELVNIRSVVLEEELSSDEIDEIAGELRVRMTYDSLYGQVDNMIWEFTDSIDNLPHYGEIQPEPGREALLNEMEKNRKQFEMVDLVAPSWTIQVPRRKK